MKHLTYHMLGAYLDCKEERHPQLVMKELGITYQHATPQSIADLWQFWNCENVPEKLPSFIEELDADPKEWIGFGLSKEDVEQIKQGHVEEEE